MDPIENVPPAPEPQVDIPTELARLRQLVHSILILAIVVSGTLSVFLFNQLRLVRKELEQIRSNVAQYDRTAGVATDEFIKKLAAFSKTHADYQPIAARFGLLTNVPVTPVTPSATAPSKPTPASAPAKK